MTRDWQVYGWISYRIECPPAPNGNRQTREICLAPSVAAITRATGMSRADYKLQGDVTGNREEIALATSQPGTVFWRPLNNYGDWRGAEKIR